MTPAVLVAVTDLLERPAMRTSSHRLLVALLLSLLSSTVAAAEKVVCIDPGHGGSDPGAVGCGLEEAAVVLDVSWKLHALLEADPDLKPIMTRTSDTYVSLGSRCDYANDQGATRFASVHCNAYNGQATGIETFCYSNGSSVSFDQRDRIQDYMTSTWPALTDRGGKTAGFYVLKHTNMPATLSELAFVDNCATDATYLSSQTQLAAAASAHHQALRESLGLSSTPPDVEPPDVEPPTGTGLLKGAVFEDQGVGSADMSIRLGGAVVKVEGEGIAKNVAAAPVDGMFVFDLSPGNYSVTASMEGYWDNTRMCSVTAGMESWCSMGLHPKPVEEPPAASGLLQGVVYEDLGQGNLDMSVRLTGAIVKAYGADYGFTTGASGSDAMWKLQVPAGTYTVTSQHPGYWTNTRVCQVTPEGDNWCSIGLFSQDAPGPPAPTGDVGTLLGAVFEDLGGGGDDMSNRRPGATVRVENGGFVKFATAEGESALWQFSLNPGTYLVTALHEGYWPATRTCAVASGTEVWCSMGLTKMTADLVETDEDGVPQEDYAKPLGDPDVRTGGDGAGTFAIPGGGEDGSGGGGGCSSSGRASPAWMLLAGLLLLFVTLRRARLAGGVMLLLLAMGSAGASADPGPAAGAEGPVVLTEVRQLTPAQGYEQPVWSPDGSQIALAGDKMKELLVVSAEGGEPRLVARGESAGYGPVWSQEGRALSYRAPGQKLSDVPALAVGLHDEPAVPPRNRTPGQWLLVPADRVLLRKGDVTTPVSPPGDRYCCARSGPNGLVAFLGLATGLYIHDPASGRTWPLGPGNHPSFSHDGKRVVFDRCKDDGEQLLSCELVIAELGDGAPHLRTVHTDVPLPTSPALSPDGSQLAFSASGAIWIGRPTFRPE